MHVADDNPKPIHPMRGRLRDQMSEEYRAAVVAWLVHVRDTTGLSLNEIARRARVSHTTLTRPVSNPMHKSVPKLPTLQKIATATNVPLPRELTDALEGPPSVMGLKLLRVRGIVARGMYQAAELVNERPTDEVTMVEEPKYRGLPQWAEINRGPSMNRTYNDGDYLHVVDAEALNYRPLDGDDVIVERPGAQPGTLERSCVRIAMISGRPMVVGDSTVEVWNRVAPLDGGTDQPGFQIIGLVIGSYRPRRR